MFQRITLLFLVLACLGWKPTLAEDHSNYVNEWYVWEGSPSGQAIFGKRFKLNADYTFQTFEQNDLIEEGRWIVRNDSLILLFMSKLHNFNHIHSCNRLKRIRNVDVFN